MSPRKFEFRPATLASYFENWPADWPDKDHFVNQHTIQRPEFEALKKLVEERASETSIEKCLAENPSLLAQVTSLFSTGHHAAWLYPKQQLSPPSGLTGGLIPDYVAAAGNSDGLSWFVLELKGADHSAFSTEGQRVFLSPQANRGVCQLLNYMDSASRSQSYLRDELRLTGFREPIGILLIGTEIETQNERVRLFKSAWNRSNPRLQIRSYSRLLRLIEQKLNDFKR